MKRLTASEITEPGPNHADIMDALRSVYNYFWNPDIQTPILSEGDVHDLVERALKAEPPKVCRWQKASDLYIPECHGWPIGIPNMEPKFCPECGGTISIDIEESEG